MPKLLDAAGASRHQFTAPHVLGHWSPTTEPPDADPGVIVQAIEHLTRPVYCVLDNDRLAVADSGNAVLEPDRPIPSDAWPLVGFAPALHPARLGDPQFRTDHGVRFNYVAGAMANGIASVELVTALAQSGMLAYFGAAGLDLPDIDRAIDRLQAALPATPFGLNLIHSPHDAALEAATVDCYLRRKVRRISASAYLGLTLPLVRYRVAGIHLDEQGQPATTNWIAAKVSRVEVARRFLGPPPADMLARLVQDGAITPQQAEWARLVPMADDITAEADSGGHTDNRPALTLLPTMLALRDELHARHGFDRRPRVGAAGGIATPASAAAAFSLGAAYILTGTINQACVEAGTSATVKQMLAAAQQADVAMAPAADMFEMGVQVQVLKRGTLFPVRARKLYELYRRCASLADIPAKDRAGLEKDLFRMPLEQAWAQTEQYWQPRDPAQLDRAAREPKHQLALLFRAYLGQSSGWANAGESTRQADYQVWCGPAMGAFNEWAKGSFLESADQRDGVTVALNLLVGAAALTRTGWLRAQGLDLPSASSRFVPRRRAELELLLDDATEGDLRVSK